MVAWVFPNMPVNYDLVEFNMLTPGASGGWTLPYKEEKKRKIKMAYTLTVKDGAYGYNPETAAYEDKDLVETFKNSELAEALQRFFEEVEATREDAAYGSDPVPVTLTFTAKKKGKK